jgi:metallo-beta-lactamase family protein
MATGGRVVHHLARMLPDSRNTVILVGYQSLGTRGRSLADGAKSLKMHGKVVKVLAEITKVGEFSVHADSREMIDWLRTVKMKPRKVFIVHGESDAGVSFQKKLNQELSWDSTIPEHGSTHEI